MRDGYPSRESHFAHRAIRLMVKSCAVQEMGQTAALLVVVVAMTEDAKRYSGPVTFFAAQLIPLLGVRKWETLDRARTRAIDAGWLHYESPPARGPSTGPGRYWVTIPVACSRLDDSPVDESSPESYPPNGDDDGDDGEDDGGDDRGEPSSLSLSQEEAKEGESKTLHFLLKDGTEWTIPKVKISEYEETYPAINVAAELRKARQWCRDNPDKRKTARGMTRFLNGWLTKAGGNQSNQNGHNKTQSGGTGGKGLQSKPDGRVQQQGSQYDGLPSIEIT